VPFFAKGVPGPYSTINARLESIAKTPSYRGPWKRSQRCILPVSGFYEWHLTPDNKKQPFYITCTDQNIFGLAGLWDRSVREDGIAIESCTIITMPANSLMHDIHNTGSNPHRMPAILAANDADAWLGGTVEQAQDSLKRYPADLMVAWPVSTRVNTPTNNDAQLIAAHP
jgi:putative SOS response-associated peptidase YedK